MPRVPTYDSPQVAANTLPAARLDAPQSRNYGSDQAQQFGQASERLAGAAGSIAADLASQANAARIDDSVTGLVKADTDLRMQALQLRGRDAFERPDGKALPDEFVEKFDVIAREIESGLGNDAQKAAFRRQSAQLRQSLYSGLSSHVLKQWQTYQDRSLDAKLDTAGERIAAMPENDETAAQSLGAIEAAARDKVRRNGGNDEMADAEVRKLRDAAYYSRYQAWMQTDPLAAQASFQHNREQIGPLMRNRIANELLQAGAQGLAQVVKPWVADAGGARTGGPWPTGTPRGIRNNNPGNIVQTAERWQGEVDGDDPRYATFATPEAGIRAIGKNLLTFQEKHGLDTVSGIVSRWSPATENDTHSYIATVSKALGVKPEDKLDLRDATVMAALMRAMIGVENGQQPYSDTQIATGVNAALGKASLPDAAAQAGSPLEPAWRDPNAKTGIPLIDNLPPAHRAYVLALAHAQLRQDGTQARASLTARANDAKAEYLNTGQATNPPSEAEFLQAYGQQEGVRHYRELQDTATLGAQLQQTKTLSNADLMQMLKNAEPSPGDGYAERARNYGILQKAVQMTVAARKNDPVQFAMQNPAYDLKPIANMEDRNALLTELSRRRSAMDAIARDYGTPPKMLSKPESLAFADMLANKQTPDKIQTLRLIDGLFGQEGMEALSQQIKGGNPSLAIAAMLSAYTDDEGNNAGKMYLEGLDAKEQNRAKIDPAAETGTKAQIYEAIDSVYQTPQERDAAAMAVLGIYAKLKSDDHDDPLGRAIDLATGGISTINGAKVARPWGWTESRVRDALTIAAPHMIARDGGQFIVGGQQIDAADFAKMLPGMRLQTLKQGTYTLGEGSRIARNPDGSPYVLDLRRMADRFRAVQVQEGLGAYYPARPAPGLRHPKTKGP